MAYELKYTFSFRDRHVVTPATWRVDILDGEHAAGSVYTLIPSGDPLITERIETDDEKANFIIGRQITFAYEFTGAVGEPLPEEFFEASERRWRVEVYRNNVLDGVYYIKPDFCSRTWKHTPYTITLKAVDGFSYAKAVPFDMYDTDQKLVYDKVSLYETMLTRALHQIVDDGTHINILCSLTPTNIEAGKRLLNGTFIHTDIFYDFVTGPVMVHDVITAFCKTFYARCFIAGGQVWFVRMQDLTSDTFTVERYESESTVADVAVPEMLASGGSTVGAFDVLPIDDDPELPMVPALKKATFEVNYQGINRLANFDWQDWNGADFAGWFRETNLGEQIQLQRTGAGTIGDPYKAFIPFPNATNGFRFWQDISVGSAFVGDLIDIEIKTQFFNVKKWEIRVAVTVPDTPFNAPLYILGADGRWLPPGNGTIAIVRSGKKRDGSFKIKTAPIPAYSPNGSGPFNGPFGVRLELWKPTDYEALDPGSPDGVAILPIKLGIINLASKGRRLVAINGAQFSREKTDPQSFNFIDTGDDGASNTLFTGAAKEPVASWESSKPGIVADDIERHMVRAHIDQYARSLQSWEGSLYSNTLEYYSVIEFDALPGKRYLQLRDTYNNLTCTHEVSLIELLPEGGAQVEIREFDIEEENE